MKRTVIASLVILAAMASNAVADCRSLNHADNRYTVCRFDAKKNQIRLFLRDQQGDIYGAFQPLSKSVAENGEVLRFAMNAGMYDVERRPVGLYVENGKLLKKANTKNGYGNFHLMPNGIFWVKGNQAGVGETKSYLKHNIQPDFATQSGPMLVINGKLHPRFLAQSDSLKIRNGVGVESNGHVVWFAISEQRVSFYAFGTLFRDALKTPNALFLDGSVSKIYAPELNRLDRGLRMGPIVGVVSKAAEAK